ncbi:MAG TPA: hypothetical protein VH560_04095 [Polyangia bacterium]|nr:hypothetical protein [Polyangia bacterium]
MATRLKHVGIGVVLAMGLGVSAGGCGNASHAFGDVIMTVTVPDDVQIQSASYTLDDMIDAPSMGVIGGSQPVQQLDELISHVPASAQYALTVQAETADGLMDCTGSAPVTVMNGATTRVQVTLKCGGHVLVGIGVTCDASPLVDFLVSPLAASVGTYVIAQAAPSRPDGGPLTFAWSGSPGVFADAAASQTTFTCSQPGPVTIKHQVHDDELCQQSYASTVTCLSAVDAGAADALSADTRVDAGSDAGSD